jgi:hypothetical protein
VGAKGRGYFTCLRCAVGVSSAQMQRVAIFGSWEDFSRHITSANARGCSWAGAVDGWGRGWRFTTHTHGALRTRTRVISHSHQGYNQLAGFISTNTNAPCSRPSITHAAAGTGLAKCQTARPPPEPITKTKDKDKDKAAGFFSPGAARCGCGRCTMYVATRFRLATRTVK